MKQGISLEILQTSKGQQGSTLNNLHAFDNLEEMGQFLKIQTTSTHSKQNR